MSDQPEKMANDAREDELLTSAPSEADVQQADLEAIMAKYDRESVYRVLPDFRGKAIGFIAVALGALRGRGDLDFDVGCQQGQLLALLFEQDVGQNR